MTPSVCKQSPLTLFQCPTTENLENSACSAIVNLPETINNRQISPTSHRDIGDNKSLITFTGVGATANDTSIGVFFVDRQSGNIDETFSFHSRMIISAHGIMETTPILLNDALISQSQLFLATQSLYDVSDDNDPAILSGFIFAIPFTEEGTIDQEPLNMRLLTASHNNALNLIPRSDATCMTINSGIRTNDLDETVSSGLDEIETPSLPTIVRTDLFDTAEFQPFPNIALSSDKSLAIAASLASPWKLYSIDLIGRRVNQEMTLPETATGVSSIAIAGVNIFVTDPSGQMFWFDFTNNLMGGEVSDPIDVASEAGPSAIADNIVYQAVPEKIIAIDPQQL